MNVYEIRDLYDKFDNNLATYCSECSKHKTCEYGSSKWNPEAKNIGNFPCARIVMIATILDELKKPTRKKGGAK